jgi:hypothetical protein
MSLLFPIRPLASSPLAPDVTSLSDAMRHTPQLPTRSWRSWAWARARRHVVLKIPSSPPWLVVRQVPGTRSRAHVSDERFLLSRPPPTHLPSRSLSQVLGYPTAAAGPSFAYAVAPIHLVQGFGTRVHFRGFSSTSALGCAAPTGPIPLSSMDALPRTQAGPQPASGRGGSNCWHFVAAEGSNPPRPPDAMIAAFRA